MRMRQMTLSEIRRQGLEALAEALGPVGMVRFLQQFELGVGDYTRERQRWLEGVRLETVIKEIKERKRRAARE